MYEFGALEDARRSIFLNHLVECEWCHNQVYSMDPFSARFREQRTAAQRERAGTRPAAENKSTSRFLGLWCIQQAIPVVVFVVLLVGAGAWIVWRSMPSRTRQVANERLSRLEHIQIPKALYSPPEKPVQMREPEKAFNSAMEAYQHDDFETAIERLWTLNELQPANTREVNFYLGVSLMLVGRNRDAIGPLNQVIESGNGRLGEKGRYYLALAYVKTGQIKEAVSEADAIIAKGGEYLVAAKQLKEAISDLSQ
jgi:tetratricopeptide (TPR) repeat protein